MEKKPILITALSSIVAGVGAGLLAFFCLPITVPVAVVTGVAACAVLGSVTAVNAWYIESEVRMKGEEQGASNLESNYDDVITAPIGNAPALDKNSTCKCNDKSDLILSKLHSMDMKQDQRYKASCQRYRDQKNTSSENRLSRCKNKLNSRKVIIKSAQSTGLQNHGLFPSANDAQVNQVPSTTDTPNTIKKRPEFRNGATKR